MTPLIITGLLAALAIGLAVLYIRRPRDLAINAAPPVAVETPESMPVEAVIPADAATGAPAIPITVGLPQGMDAKRVLDRKVALVRAGTEPLVAEKLAIDAESQQMLRDKHLKASVHTEEVPVTAKVPVVETEPDASRKGKK